MRQSHVEALPELVCRTLLCAFGLVLQEDLKQLWRSIRTLCLRSDLSDPGVLGWRLLVKDEDLIVCHSLLSNNHLLTAVNDEIAALVKLAVFATANSVVSVQRMKLTELRPKHNWDLANSNSSRVILIDDLFDFASFLPSLLIGDKLMSEQLLFRQGNVHKKLCCISQIPHPCLMWKYSLIFLILLSDAWT